MKPLPSEYRVGQIEIDGQTINVRTENGKRFVGDMEPQAAVEKRVLLNRQEAAPGVTAWNLHQNRTRRY